jgi:hypothetical protein
MSRFPALEPEPAPTGIAARLGRAGVVLAAVVTVVAAGVALPAAIGRTGDHALPSASPSTVPPPVGRVVVIDGQHVAVTDARGQLMQALTGDLRIDPQFATLVPAPPRRRAVTGPGLFGPPTGQLVPLDRPSATVASAVPADLLRNGGLADEPWTDNGRAVVLVSGDARDQVGIVDIGTGRLAPLGDAVAAAGIPDARAVVVASGGTTIDVPDGFPVRTATRIELRAPGRPPTVLHDVDDLARQAKVPSGQPVVVDRISVSPDGRLILVAFDIAGAHEFPDGPANRPRVEPAGAIVVLDRHGAVKDVRPAMPGRRLDWVRWSSTDLLALGESATTETINTDERVLSYWDRRRPPVTITLRGAFENTLLSPCVWSPRADRLLCGDDRGWYDVDPATGESVVLSGVTGRPVIWLP